MRRWGKLKFAIVPCLVIACVVLVLAAVPGRVSAQTIAVTSPAASSVWDGGGTYEITWTSSGAVGPNVKIEYDYLIYTAPTAIVIVDSTANDGSYSWTIPSGISPRTDYFIRVSDPGDGSVFDDSGWFQIQSPPFAMDPLIVVLLIIVIVVVVVVIGVAVWSSKKKKAATPPPPPAGVYAAPPYPPASYGAPVPPPPPGTKTCWSCEAPLPAAATTCGKCGSYV